MLHKSFGDFVDKKRRDAIKQLNLVEKLLQKSGFKVEAFLAEDADTEPYVFCYNPRRNATFDGVRIYKIGNSLAFRVQQEAETHPYGKAYPLNIEEMFQDFLSDDGITQRQAAEKCIESVSKEIRMFFDKSENAERSAYKAQVFDRDNGDGDIGIKSTGTDYSAMIYSKS